MKMSTTVWAQMESPGRPAATRRVNGPVSHVVMQFAKWMAEAYMGSHIRLTIARTEIELESILSRKATMTPDEDMLSELESFIDSLDEEEEPEFLPATET